MNERRGKGLSFAKRMHIPRAIGTGLGFFCVMIGIAPLEPGLWVWVVLAAHGFVWPHLAYLIARSSAQPFRAEQRNLIFDGFAGGCWAGAMGLNPLPSVIILSMIAMDKIAAGGWHMLFKTLLAQTIGIGLGLWLYAPPLFPQTSQAQMLACLPILLIYPMAIGMICYQVTVQLAQHKRALARLSETDSLTGLSNHGAWQNLLLREFGRCRGSLASSHLALIDIDHFKLINDRHGHLVGDNILRVLSATLSLHLRKRDPAARYGGDEFCVMLPDTTADQAMEILERLRRAVEAFRDPALPQLSLSVSIGVAPFGAGLANAEAWLHAADMALYAAKSAGRNRIMLAGAEGQGLFATAT
ncbi:TPA: diguanylate cyclase [Pseudomonas putida]|uniref:diguanylate cyclase n=1 Tax=Pseudomonas sp. TaxID=306 RepID=UPI0028A6989F|nr:diguanylate cyclase [Pseudomonas sp.]